MGRGMYVVGGALSLLKILEVTLVGGALEYKEFQNGAKPPGIWKTLLGILSPYRSTNNYQNLQSYRILWMGVGAQLTSDVPFSSLCWSTLEPIRRRLPALVGEGGNSSSILEAKLLSRFCSRQPCCCCYMSS